MKEGKFTDVALKKPLRKYLIKREIGIKNNWGDKWACTKLSNSEKHLNSSITVKEKNENQ